MDFMGKSWVSAKQRKQKKKRYSGNIESFLRCMVVKRKQKPRKIAPEEITRQKRKE